MRQEEHAGNLGVDRLPGPQLANWSLRIGRDFGAVEPHGDRLHVHREWTQEFPIAVSVSCQDLRYACVTKPSSDTTPVAGFCNLVVEAERWLVGKICLNG